MTLFTHTPSPAQTWDSEAAAAWPLETRDPLLSVCPLDSSLGVTAPHPPRLCSPGPGACHLESTVTAASHRVSATVVQPSPARGGGTDPRTGTPRASVLTGCHVHGFSQVQSPGAGVAPGCWCGPRAPIGPLGASVGPWVPVWPPGAGVAPGCHCGPLGASVAPGRWCGPRAPIGPLGASVGLWVPVWPPGAGVGPGHQRGPRGVLLGFGEWRTVLTSWSRNQAPVGIPRWCGSEGSALTAEGPAPISTPLLCPAPVPLSCGSTLLLRLPLNFPQTPEGVCERVWRRGDRERLGEPQDSLVGAPWCRRARGP